VDTTRTLLLALLISLGPALNAEAAPAVEFSPPEWKYGMIQQGDIARMGVVAMNRSAAAVRLDFVPTCDCLGASPATALIAPGSSAAFSLSFDSKDDFGITRRGFIVRTDLAGAKPLYYLLSGVVRVDRKEPAGAAAAGGSPRGAGAPAGAIELRYYYTPGCRSCEEFLSADLPDLEARYGYAFRVERRDLLDAAAYEELAAFASSTGAAVTAVPALRIGDLLLQGDAEIRDRLPGLLVARASAGGAAWTAPAAQSPAAVQPAAPSAAGSARLAMLPVMAAGLIDGVNPCAFTTLIFLLASLALAGRGRREVLVIGALFSLGVFLTYLGVGFGLFAALRAASAISLVSAILRWVLFAALVAFAGLSVHDYFLIRAGKASEMLLQLPGALKGRIHASIRARSRSAALAGSSLVLGFLVSIFEFACTGQVYLPTLAYLARVQKRADALGLLILYNFCFIVPLLAVFAATYLGVSSKRITVLFQAHMGAVKLALALAFLGLAAMTVLA
jgi:cytochrome c biogenesis protein CcdA